MKCTGISPNPPFPPSQLSVEKLSSMKLVPGPRKFGDRWSRGLTTRSEAAQLSKEEGL